VDVLAAVVQHVSLSGDDDGGRLGLVCDEDGLVCGSCDGAIEI
jgi:hypothetical protein